MCGGHNMKTRFSILVATTLLLLSVASARAQEVRVAAAADLKFAMQDVATQFEKQSGTKLDVTYGSSGNFFAQVQNGAPFDVFFSADIDYPKKLDAAGLVEPGTFYPYAKGKIVLWVPNQSKLDLGRGLQVMLEPGINKIAIANPEH